MGGTSPLVIGSCFVEIQKEIIVRVGYCFFMSFLFGSELLLYY